jgi:hypothetical protein
MGFWEDIYELRRTKKIPLQWRRSHIEPYLREKYEPTTILTVPSNQSISKDGVNKGNYVKRGMEAKAYRIDRGLFQLINDPGEALGSATPDGKRIVAKENLLERILFPRSKLHQDEVFHCLSVTGEPLAVGQWVDLWASKYPAHRYSEEVYRYLIQKGARLNSQDILLLGAWKDAALQRCRDNSGMGPFSGQYYRFNQRWSKDAASAAFEIWQLLSEKISEIKAIFEKLGKLTILKYGSSGKGGQVTKRFGLARASTLIHFLTSGKYPIYDSNVHKGIYGLTLGMFRGVRIPRYFAGRGLTVAAYCDVFCPAVQELLLASDRTMRSVDRALFTYGSKKSL